MLHSKLYYILMSAPLLSVSLVIPALNEEKYIRKCLEAIDKQTVKPLEVIVVDNGSADSTREIAQSFPFVRLVREPRTGILYARNKGFNLAKGDIIGRIDADTVLSKNWIEQASRYLSGHKGTVAITGPGSFYDIPLGKASTLVHAGLYFHVQKALTGVLSLWGANMAIRRSAWQTVKEDCLPFDKSIDEDIDLSIQLHKRGMHSAYLHRMQVEASMRHGDIRLHSLIKYLSSWHKNYTANKMHFRGALIYGLKIMLLVVILPLALMVNLRRR